MPAVCTDAEACGWSGTQAEVIHANGKCPECRGAVSYTSAPLAAPPRITDPQEFARRAVTALQVANTSLRTTSFVSSLARLVSRGRALSVDQLQSLMKIVNRHAPNVRDMPVRDYAVLHARGAD